MEFNFANALSDTTLDEKIQAPIVVFEEDLIDIQSVACCKICLKIKENDGTMKYKIINERCIDRIYDNHNKSIFENPYPSETPINIEVPEYLRGTQVVFNSQIVYEGENVVGLHFSKFNIEGKYCGYDYRGDLGLYFSDKIIKAMFDREGELLWKNSKYKPKDVKFEL